MKTYKIVSFNSKEYSYRIYGNKYGKTLEMFEGTDLVHGKSVSMSISPLGFVNLKEAANILENSDNIPF